MKHAGPDTLAHLAALRAALRGLPGLAERRPGCFYRRGQAFLHFHDDAAGRFADVRLAGPHFTRLAVTDAAGQADLLRRVQQALRPPTASVGHTPGQPIL